LCFSMNTRARVTRKRLANLEKISPKITKLVLTDIPDLHTLPIIFSFLEILDLSRSSIYDEALTKIVQNHHCLLSLILVSCKELKFPQIRSDSLTELILDDASVKEDGLNWLTNFVSCPNLHVLGVGNWKSSIVNSYLAQIKRPSHWDTTIERVYL